MKFWKNIKGTCYKYKYRIRELYALYSISTCSFDSKKQDNQSYTSVSIILMKPYTC